MSGFEDWWDNSGERKAIRFVRWWSCVWLVGMLSLAALECFDQRWGWTAYYAVIAAWHAYNLRWALRAEAEREQLT